MYVKLSGFRLRYKVLQNAGLAEYGLNLDTSWCKLLSKSDSDTKTREFRWGVSHKAMYTFIILHELDAEISSQCILCKIKEPTTALL